MESSASGHFEDYRPGKPLKPTSPGNTGSTENSDVCDREILNARLEEIERAEYYLANSKVPANGTQVGIRRELVKGRIAVETSVGGLSLGYLPTSLNYLLACLRSGRTYAGAVVATAEKPVPRIVVDLRPS